ncbi:MAG: hypothetical protein KDN22_14440 [Verrucomicrobiae bacterium]|nr:hypothetical protein [Verrucomicrobiae bacterium]
MPKKTQDDREKKLSRFAYYGLTCCKFGTYGSLFEFLLGGHGGRFVVDF